MRVAGFYHSLVSDWNHGNAHFLRGIVSELQARGHSVCIFEPEDGWSYRNLVNDYGPSPLLDFAKRFPHLRSETYNEDTLDLDRVLDGVDLVLVHEWTAHNLVARIGEHRKHGGNHRLLFHDTHHRAITEPESMASYDLSGFDGVLAFGNALREIYVKRGWGRQVWTWHEAADTRVFHPVKTGIVDRDLIWIGNWGDEERTAELFEFLLDPVRDLGLRATVHGVRYPEPAIKQLQERNIQYGGWLPNWQVPGAFARHKVTVHVPRQPYSQVLRGIPTIRPFEALACGIPLISAPWDDVEHLFREGCDYLVARDGAEMRAHLTDVLNDESLAKELREHGLETIRARHTCAHRVDELLTIYEGLTCESHSLARA